ncbi:AAA family ATPase [Alphaproteobacteria bacterium]|nr:AAA family ATPase [Alphaproteobacteria bacterium]
MTLDFNPEFELAIRLMDHTNQNLFITGKAGTGKSTLLDYFCNHTKKKPVVLAPTGVAALNVKGQTIHRFFNFYIDVTPEKIRSKDTKPRDPKLYKKLKTIIIDEVSMLRADLLDCIDVFLRMYGPDTTQAFGGVQMVFVGDLYQLPPVVGKEERDIFRTHYATPYFFSSKALESESLEVVELEKVYRQKDEQFLSLLNKIRNNSVEPEDIEELNQRHLPDVDSHQEEAFTISLTTTNANADEINETHLKALTGKLYSQKAVIKGDFGKEYYPTATTLQFKVGSQIMLLNNDQKKRWVNGSIGIIEEVTRDEDGEEYLRVRLHDNDRLISVSPFIWEVYKFSVEDGAIVSEPAGKFTQYPFRLAWAVTIHKSQGKTFNRVVIDIGRGTFASGQTYVGLSRCTSFEGVYLKVPIKKQDIRTDPRIYKFLTSHAYKKAAEILSFDDKLLMLEKAVKTKQPLEMTYLKANDTKSTQTILPLTVGEEDYQGKKFSGMLASCTKGKEERMFNVARILDLKET